MFLYLMRHGDAILSAPSDAERPLSDRGRQEVATMAPMLQHNPPKRLLASPYLRAQQTAEIVQASLKDLGIKISIETLDTITPNDDPQETVRYLDQLDSVNTLIVTHQPLVGILITLLRDGHCSTSIPMPTAGIACLEFEVVGTGQADLCWLKHPHAL